jgi:hypothetical protein
MADPTRTVLEKDQNNTITAPVILNELPLAVQGVDPSTQPDIGKFFTKTAGGRVEAHYRDDTGAITQITAAGAVNGGGGGGGGGGAGVTAIDAVLTTLNTTPVSIYTYTPSAVSKLIAFQVQLMASNQVSTAQFVLSALFSINSGGVISEHDTTFLNGPFRDQPSWDVALNINAGTIEFLVTGSFDAVDWRITGTATEHSLGAGPGA